MPKEYTREFSVLGNIPFTGKVIYWDGFENGIRWYATGDGSDWEVLNNKAQAYSGKFGCRLQSKATSPTSGDSVYIRRDVHCRPSRIAELFFRWNHRGVGVLQYLTIRLTGFLGGDLYDARIRYDSDGMKWQYYDENMNWTDVPNGGQFIEDEYWADFKFQVNYENQELKTLTCNRREFDLSGLNFYFESGVGEGDRYTIRVVASTRTTTRATVDLDDLLLSAD